MPILFVGYELDRVEAHLVAALSVSGFKITVLCSPTSPNLETAAKNGACIEPIYFKSRFDLNAILRLKRFVQQNNFKIIYALTARALTGLVLIRAYQRAKLMAYRGTVGHSSWYNPISHLTFLNKNISKLICVSHAVQDYMHLQGVPEEKLIVIPKGHRSEWYINNNSAPKNSFVICAVANMRPVKGIDILLRAFELLNDIHDIELVLVGKSTPAITNLAKNRKIHCTGFVPDGYKLMAKANIFVLPSRAREGLPKALLEAMFQGVPVIVTNVGGMAEVVQDNISGLVVPPEDPVSLAAAIRKLYQDKILVEQLGKNGKARVEQEYNFENTVRMYKEVFEL